VARLPNFLQIFFLPEVQFSKMLCQLIPDLLTQLLMPEIVSLSLLTNELIAVTNKLLAMYLNFHEFKWYFTGSELLRAPEPIQLAIHRNM